MDVILEESFTARPAFRPEPEPERVREAARILSQAERPVIVAGGGVTASGAQAEVVQLAEMLNIPVATALNAKGCIPENHPLSVGVVGSYSRWSANRVVSEADLVLFIGSHTGSQVTLGLADPGRRHAGGPKSISTPPSWGVRTPGPTVCWAMPNARCNASSMSSNPVAGNAGWVAQAQEHVQNWRQEKPTSVDLQ